MNDFNYNMIDKHPLVSVVMLNYNGLQYLKRTINPILELDYPNLEFIIVDNGSDDGSLEYVQSFKEIKLVQSPRLQEKNFACNYAINKANGPYIFLCDNDLLITDKDLLSGIFSMYKKNKNIGTINIAFSNEGETKTKGYGNFQGYFFEKTTAPIDNSLIYKLDNIKICHPSGIGIFFSKDFWKKVGGYDDHLAFGGCDTDIGIKSLLFGYENRLFSKSIQFHIGMPERTNNKKYSVKFKKTFYAHLYTIVKNYSFLNMIVTIIGYSIFILLKAIKQSIKRLHLGPFIAFFEGYYLFIVNLPVAIKKRKEIQAKRVIKEDIFLMIKPPKIK